MINTPLFNLFTTEEFISFCNQYFSIVEKSEKDLPNISNSLQNIHNSLNTIEVCCNKTISKSFIQAVIRTNTNRDDALKAIKHYLQYCEKRVKPEWKALSKLLQKEFAKIKIQCQGSDFISESTGINAFIKKLQHEDPFAEAVRTLKLSNLLSELQESEAAFEIALQTRSQIISEDQTFEAEYAFRTIRNSIELINNYIGIMQQIKPSTFLVTTINSINEIIISFNYLVLTRKKRIAHQL